MSTMAELVETEATHGLSEEEQAELGKLREEQAELDKLPQLPLDELRAEKATEHGGEVFEERGQYGRMEHLEGTILAVPVNLIHPNPDQPRKYFTQGGATRLSSTVRAVGQLDPIKIVPFITQEGKVEFALLDGERRWRRAMSKGLTTIKATICWSKDNSELYLKSFAANLGRENHNPIEYAYAIVQCMDIVREQYGLPERATGKIKDKVVELTGINRAMIEKYLRFLTLDPAVRELLAQDKIKESHANQIASIHGIKVRELLKRFGVERFEDLDAAYQITQTDLAFMVLGITSVDEILDLPKATNGTVTRSKLRVAAKALLGEVEMDDTSVKAETLASGSLDGIARIIKALEALEAASPEEQEFLLEFLGRRSGTPTARLLERTDRAIVLLERFRDRVRALHEVSPLPPIDGKPGFEEYVEAQAEAFSGRTDTRLKIVRELAKASDKISVTVTAQEIAESLKVSRETVSGILKNLDNELRPLGLSLQTIERTVRGATGRMDKQNTYRLMWAEHVEALDRQAGTAEGDEEAEKLPPLRLSAKEIEAAYAECLFEESLLPMDQLRSWDIGGLGHLLSHIRVGEQFKKGAFSAGLELPQDAHKPPTNGALTQRGGFFLESMGRAFPELIGNNGLTKNARLYHLNPQRIGLVRLVDPMGAVIRAMKKKDPQCKRRLDKWVLPEAITILGERITMDRPRIAELLEGAPVRPGVVGIDDSAIEEEVITDVDGGGPAEGAPTIEETGASEAEAEAGADVVPLESGLLAEALSPSVAGVNTVEQHEEGVDDEGDEEAPTPTVDHHAKINKILTVLMRGPIAKDAFDDQLRALTEAFSALEETARDEAAKEWGLDDETIEVEVLKDDEEDSEAYFISYNFETHQIGAISETEQKNAEQGRKDREISDRLTPMVGNLKPADKPPYARYRGYLTTMEQLMAEMSEIGFTAWAGDARMPLKTFEVGLEEDDYLVTFDTEKRTFNMEAKGEIARRERATRARAALLLLTADGGISDDDYTGQYQILDEVVEQMAPAERDAFAREANLDGTLTIVVGEGKNAETYFISYNLETHQLVAISEKEREKAEQKQKDQEISGRLTPMVGNLRPKSSPKYDRYHTYLAGIERLMAEMSEEGFAAWLRGAGMPSGTFEVGLEEDDYLVTFDAEERSFKMEAKAEIAKKERSTKARAALLLLTAGGISDSDYTEQYLILDEVVGQMAPAERDAFAREAKLDGKLAITVNNGEEAGVHIAMYDFAKHELLVIGADEEVQNYPESGFLEDAFNRYCVQNGIQSTPKVVFRNILLAGEKGCRISVDHRFACKQLAQKFRTLTYDERSGIATAKPALMAMFFSWAPEQGIEITQNADHPIHKFEGDLFRFSAAAVRKDPALLPLMHHPVKRFDVAFKRPADYRLPPKTASGKDNRPQAHQDYDEKLKTLFSIYNPKDLESGNDTLLIVAIEGRCDFKRVKNVQPEDLIPWPKAKKR